MIILLKPLNHLGGLVAAGTILSLGEKEAALVKSGAAEYCHPAKSVGSPIGENTNTQALAYSNDVQEEPKKSKEPSTAPEQQSEASNLPPELGRKMVKAGTAECIEVAKSLQLGENANSQALANLVNTPEASEKEE